MLQQLQGKLDSFHLDPREGIYAMVCPFCGGAIVYGVRKDSGRRSLGHTAVDDPLRPGFPFAGCERFVELATTQLGEFLKLLKSAGARFAKLT